MGRQKREAANVSLRIISLWYYLQKKFIRTRSKGAPRGTGTLPVQVRSAATPCGLEEDLTRKFVSQHSTVSDGDIFVNMITGYITVYKIFNKRGI